MEKCTSLESHYFHLAPDEPSDYSYCSHGVSYPILYEDISSHKSKTPKLPFLQIHQFIRVMWKAGFANSISVTDLVCAFSLGLYYSSLFVFGEGKYSCR